MKGAIFNVGPLDNKYAGPHTYADVLFPFVQELNKNGFELDWVGIELNNEVDNAKLKEFGLEYQIQYHNDVYTDMNCGPMKKSWDFIDAAEYDFLLCQPRPLDNEVENKILFTLINKFLDAGKVVYVWEQDMFTDGFTERMCEEVVFLHPAEVGKDRFKKQHHFPFFTFTPKFTSSVEPERDADFLFMGNIYGRQPQALQFFGPLNNASFDKLVFGSWVADEARREFSSQFDKFEFAGSTEHWAAIPMMQRAKATLHIVPDFARDRGLMTARVFTSHMAKCLCFCDAAIVGAEKYFPPELIVKDGNEIVERWDEVQANREDILARRELLMKEFTVENAVRHFKELCSLYVKRDIR